jgi:hypothetical protein
MTEVSLYTKAKNYCEQQVPHAKLDVFDAYVSGYLAALEDLKMPPVEEDKNENT